MKEKIISEIIREMLSSLNNEQLSKLKTTLEIYLYNVSIEAKQEADKEKEEVENIVKELKEALEKNDMDKVKTIKENLQEKAMNLSAKVYEQAAKEQQENSNNETANDDSKKDDVQDAEYEEK